MKVLFDTHAYLWAVTEDRRLSPAARKIFTAADNDILLSVASLWEILVKAENGKLPFPSPVSPYIRAQLKRTSTAVLPILLPHVLQLEKLPSHHRDPFDRIILAQAIEEDIPLVSVDKKFHLYPVEVLW
ncbi:MAG: type II toxin-antitoxin system VapC family toxin [Candidatus Korobacteraceae bacterium]